MVNAFEEASAVERMDGDVFRARIPEGWQQGRGAFGGLVLGTLLRAMEQCEPDAARSARVLTGELCGAVLPGEAEIHAGLLRRGGRVTYLDAQLRQQGQVMARASAVLASSRDDVVAPALPAPAPPAPPPWDRVAPVPVQPPFGPAFARFYEYRPIGPAPFTGGAEPVASGWIREKSRPERLDAAALIGRLDAWWPALFAVSSRPRASATVAFTAELLCDPAALPAGEPLFYRAHVAALREWMFVELRELWHEDRLVAMNQQTFALLS
jgi:hypothetical protein